MSVSFSVNRDLACLVVLVKVYVRSAQELLMNDL